jgi:hypothetical protein
MTQKLYECKICSYSTKNKGDMAKHITTQIHTKRMKGLTDNEKIYKCDLCQAIFANRHTLYRHKKSEICLRKKKNSGTENNMMDKVLKEINIRDKKRDKQMSQLMKLLEDQKSAKIINNTINIQYIVKNYKDTPVLQSMTQEDILNIEHYPDNDLIDCMLHYAYNNSLITYLADIITKHYKKDDPTQQSFWNTDSARLHYLVRTNLYGDVSKWIRDKDGVIVIERCIRPILESIKNDINMFFTKQNSDEAYNKTDDHIKYAQELELLGSIVTDITTNVLEQKILKKITPRFYMALMGTENNIKNDNSSDDTD